MASNIDTQIKEKGDLIRQLKADPSSDEATVKTAVSELLALKAEKAKSEGRDPSEVKEGSSAGGSKKGKNAITLKVPKVRILAMVLCFVEYPLTVEHLSKGHERPPAGRNASAQFNLQDHHRCFPASRRCHY